MLADATGELLDWPIVAIGDYGSNIHQNAPFPCSLQLEEFKIPLWFMSTEIFFFSFNHTHGSLISRQFTRVVSPEGYFEQDWNLYSLTLSKVYVSGPNVGTCES